MDKKIIQKAGKYYTLEERHQIIQELIATGCTKVEIWENILRYRRTWSTTALDASTRI
ncbi:MAG: hypothetical protein IPP65_09430 [Chlorobi bacterium]|nr:hypothetical protein [Chlorobiota bacterium]